MSELKKVNIFCGRFQPFHSGHLKCCEDAYKENGYPVFIFYTPNKQFDGRKPFDDKLIEEEYDIITKKYDYIEGYDWMQHPMPVRMCRILKEKGYEGVLWLAGEDRIDSYKKLLNQTSIDKITNELEVQVPEIYQTERYGSATAVRAALKAGNKKEYIKLMPKGTENLYDKFKEQIDAVKEGMSSIVDYIYENANFLIKNHITQDAKLLQTVFNEMFAYVTEWAEDAYDGNQSDIKKFIIDEFDCNIVKITIDCDIYEDMFANLFTEHFKNANYFKQFILANEKELQDMCAEKIKE